jgi:hypothetical protein
VDERALRPSPTGPPPAPPCPGGGCPLPALPGMNDMRRAGLRCGDGDPRGDPPSCAVRLVPGMNDMRRGDVSTDAERGGWSTAAPSVQRRAGMNDMRRLGLDADFDAAGGAAGGAAAPGPAPPLRCGMNDMRRGGEVLGAGAASGRAVRTGDSAGAAKGASPCAPATAPLANCSGSAGLAPSGKSKLVMALVRGLARPDRLRSKGAAGAGGGMSADMSSNLTDDDGLSLLPRSLDSLGDDEFDAVALRLPDRIDLSLLPATEMDPAAEASDLRSGARRSGALRSDGVIVVASAAKPLTVLRAMSFSNIIFFIPLAPFSAAFCLHLQMSCRASLLQRTSWQQAGAPAPPSCHCRLQSQHQAGCPRPQHMQASPCCV